MVLLRPRPRRADLDAAVRRQPLAARARLVLHRDPDAAVGTGQGRVGAALRARGEPRHGELALARRVVRHVPARRRRSPRRSRSSPAGSAASRRCTRSRTTRRSRRSGSTRITYVVSAIIVFGLPIPTPAEAGRTRSSSGRRPSREIKDGLSFIRTDRFARAVIVGLGGGVIGAGAMVPLEPGVRDRGARQQVASSACCCSRSGPARAIGVFGLLAFQKRLPRDTVFEWSIIGAGDLPGGRGRVQRRRARGGDDRRRRRVRRRRVRHRVHACCRRR